MKEVDPLLLVEKNKKKQSERHSPFCSFSPSAKGFYLFIEG